MTWELKALFLLIANCLVAASPMVLPIGGTPKKAIIGVVVFIATGAMCFPTIKNQWIKDHAGQSPTVTQFTAQPNTQGSMLAGSNGLITSYSWGQKAPSILFGGVNNLRIQNVRVVNPPSGGAATIFNSNGVQFDDVTSESAAVPPPQNNTITTTNQSGGK